MKKRICLFILLFFLILIIDTSVHATTGNTEKDIVLKNNFYYLEKYVNDNYGSFNDYVICGTSGKDCGSYGVFILNPSNGYCRNNGSGSFHSNYSVIFQISGTTLYDENTTFSPVVDHWNSAPNASTYYNGCVQYTVFSTIVISGTDCIDTLDNVVIFNEPYVVTSDSELTSWNFTNLHINSGSLSSGQTIKLSVYYASPDSIIWIDETNYSIGSYVENKFELNDDSNYWDGQLTNSDVNYYIPRSVLFNSTIRNDGLFWYKLSYYDYDGTLLGTITSNDYIVGGLTEDKVIDDTIDKTLDKMDEQIETSKGIWGTIQSILNFLNPASEEFFAYQLINLLIEAVKMLVIPSEEFINTWISDMNSWLSDRLGALYYPVDIVVDFLTRIGELDETSTAIIKINQFDLNFMGYTATVIPEYSYDLNSLLENETFKSLHDIYLVVVDVILYLGLVVLSHNTFVDIFGGQYFDDVIQTGYSTYNAYKSNEKSDKQSKFIGFKSRK